MTSASLRGLLCLLLLGCAQGHEVPDPGPADADAGASMDAESPDADSPDGGSLDGGGADAEQDASAPDAAEPDGAMRCSVNAECPSRRCEEGVCVPPPTDCGAILAEEPAATTGQYLIDPDGAGGEAAFDVRCDMDFDGGGWTLAGTLANDGTRRWDSLGAFVDAGTFGDLGAPTLDLKTPAWTAVAARDLLVRTDEYAVGWESVLGSATMAAWIAAEYDDSTCSTSFLGGRPSWAEGLTAEQIDLFELVIGALDDNSASCFPAGNENALITLTLQECCWTNGLGNTPDGHEIWQTHDLSLLRAANLVRGSCTAGTYPCNPRGYWNAGSSCYDTSCKVAWAQVWVR